jgi:hypothetical protein
MTFTPISFPQGFPPITPLPNQENSKSKVLELDLRKKRRIVKSTGLVSRQWIPWHCNVIDAIGPTAYLEIADIAAKGNHPPTLFSRLLKDELDDHEQA